MQRKQSRYTALELAFIDNVDHYFNYFDYLYLRNANIDAVGGILPTMHWKTKAFALIRKALNPWI